jgi:YggT family protein
MDDRKIADDEERRLAQLNATTSAVEHEVHSEIAQHAERVGPADAARLSEVARDMRSDAISEVEGTGREVSRGRAVARVSQVIDYLFGLLYGLLAIRLVLSLLAARSDNGFVQFIVSVTDPFYSPFKGIVSSPTVEGGHTLVLPLIIALIAYALLHAAINGLLRIFIHRKTEV